MQVRDKMAPRSQTIGRPFRICLGNRLSNRIGLGGVALLLVLCLCPDFGRADEKRHVVIVETMTLPFLQSTTAWVRKGLLSLGYKDSEDIEFTVLNAEGKPDRAKQLLSDTLAAEKIDLVVTIATLASRATRQVLKGKDLPQVFAIVADPVGEGFVSAIGEKSGSNITGSTHVVPSEVKLRVVAQSIANLAISRPFRMGLLRSSYPSAISDARYLFAQVGKFKEIEFSELAFDYAPGEAGRTEMREAARSLVKANADRLDGLWLAVGPNQLDLQFIETVLTLKVPIIYAEGATAGKAGVMLGLRSSPEINGRAVAALIDAVFRNTPVEDIPITRPESFAVGINITTAKRIGAIIPSHILELAGENIYR